jgi:hypothetical protein
MIFELLFFLLCLQPILSMEKEKLPLEIVSLLFSLPEELNKSILDLATNKKRANTKEEDDDVYDEKKERKEESYRIFRLKKVNGNKDAYFFLEQPIYKHGYKLNMYHGGEIYLPSQNMNLLEIVQAPGSLFSVQCWLGSEDHQYFRIDDDIQKLRYKRNQFSEIKRHFFDGINDNGLFIVGIDLADTTLGSQTYSFYLGKMAQKNKSDYHSDYGHIPDYDNKEHFDYESAKYQGTISALALSKTQNRCAIADDQKKISIFDIDAKNPLVDNPLAFIIKMFFIPTPLRISSSSCSPSPFLKQLSFITPNTLLGLTKKGKLIIIAADKNKPIKFYRQRVKDKSNNKFTFHSFAVDPCTPYQIILYAIENNTLLYWDLKHKILTPILKTEDRFNRIWFYKDSIGILKNINGYNNDFTQYYLSIHHIPNTELPSELVDLLSNTEVNEIKTGRPVVYSTATTTTPPKNLLSTLNGNLWIKIWLVTGIIASSYLAIKFMLHKSGTL